MQRREFLESVLSGSAIVFGFAVLSSKLMDNPAHPIPQILPGNNQTPGIKKNEVLDQALNELKETSPIPDNTFHKEQESTRSKQPVDIQELADAKNRETITTDVIAEKSPISLEQPINHKQAIKHEQIVDLAKIDNQSISTDNIELLRAQSLEEISQNDLNDYLKKIKNFEEVFPSDIFISEEKISTMNSTMARMERVQSYVGHGHYNLIGFDEMLRYSKRSQRIGKFTKKELDFLEETFFFNATTYGFYGEKLIDKLTTKTVSKKHVHKVPRSGHYLLKGRSVDIYNKITKDVGNSILLTSGVRNVVKQMHLFLAKAMNSNGNFSKASRSLAPPGHSYHAVGDFDVGKIGYGRRNFTAAFAQTKEYRQLKKLPYVKIRYTTDNRYGVRYEPWHIKVV